MKVLFVEHPNKPLNRIGYCSYYGEIYYSLKEILDITIIHKIPKKISELGQNWDAILLGFGHTDSSDKNLPIINQDTNIPLFPILNKEYTGLDNKLEWIKSMKAKAAFTVHHDYEKFAKITGLPFHRIMWSANANLFKDYDTKYKFDLFFSGVTRPEQTGNLREKILSNLDKLSKYKLSINARSQKNNYKGKVFSPKDYAKKLACSKICLVTTGPADLVGTRFFEVMAGNKSLILCNYMDNKVYGDMLIDNYNCVMFHNKDDFFDKAIYYLEHEEERLKIINNAYKNFQNNLTWEVSSKNIKKIILSYLK